MQKLLQLYAAQIFQDENPDPEGQIFNDLLDQDPEAWPVYIRDAAQRGLSV